MKEAMANGGKQKVALFFILVLVVFLGLIFHDIITELRRDPISYEMGPILSGDLCPGENLVFEATLEANKVGPIQFVTSWCQDTEVPRCSLVNSSSYYQNITRPFGPVDILYQNFVVPDLEPGKYLFSRSVRSAGSAFTGDMLIVPFTVREGCTQP